MRGGTGMGMPVRSAHRMGVSMPHVRIVRAAMGAVPRSTMIVNMNMADGLGSPVLWRMRVIDLDEGGNDLAHLNVIT